MPGKSRKAKLPASRKGWDQLSPGYRKRLGRAGVSQRDYEAGRSLTAARGHAKTPERPSRAHRQPYKYREYLTARGQASQGESITENDNLNALLDDIRTASATWAATGLRAKIEQQTGPTKIELARLLGVENSVPDFARFDYRDQLAIAEPWLRAFMTHATANNEPELAGERIILTGGRHGGYHGILPDIYKKYGIPQDSRSFWGEFKRSYSHFFGAGQLSGAA